MEAYKLGALPWRERAVAAACYGGLAPLLYFRPARRSAFVEHHQRQALATWSLGIGVFLLFLFGVLLLSYTMTWHREFYERYHLEGHLLNASRKLFLCWCVFWLFGLGLALLGTCRELPLVWRLAGWPRLCRATAILLLGFYGFGIVAAGLALHARALVRDRGEPARAYCLYHDNGMVPSWVFALGFYRVALAADARWGGHAAVMLPLNRYTLERALAEGTFVFIGSHGVRSGLLMDHGFLKPEDVAQMPKSPELSFVYLAGCDSGASRDGWTQVLAPASVVTFDRLTSVLEHAIWLWFTGPARIGNLPAP